MADVVSTGPPLPISKWRTSAGYSCVEYLHSIVSSSYHPLDSEPIEAADVRTS